jgi:hypothetical protein
MVLIPIVELYFSKKEFFFIAFNAIIAEEIVGDFSTFLLKTDGIIVL